MCVRSTAGWIGSARESVLVGDPSRWICNIFVLLVSNVITHCHQVAVQCDVTAGGKGDGLITLCLCVLSVVVFIPLYIFW